MAILLCLPLFLLMAVVFTSMAWHFGRDLFTYFSPTVRYLLLRRIVVRSATAECRKASKEKHARKHQS
jgi:hypothetical protein